MSIDEGRAVQQAVLSHAFTQSLRRYQDFLNLCPVGDAKDFAAHQAACKAAIAHMESLLKLIGALGLSVSEINEDTAASVDIEVLLADARMEINQSYRQNNQEEQEDE